nr:ribonuclease H-like domain-containing protein [Tanacetum cinerariifolium]
MVTRAKPGISKTIERMNCHVTTTSPLPRSNLHAFRDPHWHKAMVAEYNALISNGTYKARLVANGRSQQYGIDCDETFCLVVKLATIRTVLSLAVSRNWPIHQFDVKNAFLHGHDADEAVNTMSSTYNNWTPVDTESKLGYDGGLVSDPTLYRSLAGTLQYLTFTRPDISYDVQQLTACTYADWDGCPVTRQSTSRYCVFLGDNLLSWFAKRHVTLSRSSAETEYRGVTNVVAETAWL